MVSDLACSASQLQLGADTELGAGMMDVADARI